MAELGPRAKEYLGLDTPAHERLNILETLHEQVERLGLEPMSPVERHLANAVLVMLDVMIAERSGNSQGTMNKDG